MTMKSEFTKNLLPKFDFTRRDGTAFEDTVMSTHDKIEGTPEAWESRSLGAEEAYVALAPSIDSNLIDESLGLQMISIRLQKSLIDDLKSIAELNGIGYQPLIRQILNRFVTSEKNRLMREIVGVDPKINNIATAISSKRRAR